MKAIKSVNQALRMLYPNEPYFTFAIRAAYDDVMHRHYKGTLNLYREERRRRVLGVDNANLPELSRLLGSYIDYHREPFTSWKEDFEKLYHKIEECDSKHLPDDHISLDQVVAVAISSTYGLYVTQNAYLWSKSAFGDIRKSKGNDSYVYAHTHMLLDNKINGQSLAGLLKNPSATEIYRITFTLFHDGNYNRVIHATSTPDDRTLVAAHTLWYVKEEERFHVERPGMAPALIIPRRYSFIEYNDRLKYSLYSAQGVLCGTEKIIKNKSLVSW